jgi:hypothetical protein
MWKGDRGPPKGDLRVWIVRLKQLRTTSLSTIETLHRVKLNIASGSK